MECQALNQRWDTKIFFWNSQYVFYYYMVKTFIYLGFYGVGAAVLREYWRDSDGYNHSEQSSMSPQVW